MLILRSIQKRHVSAYDFETVEWTKPSFPRFHLVLLLVGQSLPGAVSLYILTLIDRGELIGRARAVLITTQTSASKSPSLRMTKCTMGSDMISSRSNSVLNDSLNQLFLPSAALFFVPRGVGHKHTRAAR